MRLTLALCDEGLEQLVSGDAHLLGLESYQRILIVTATAALAIIGGA